ncbi:hypothetical protein [Pseudonocardia adelaidensis]|uniref:Uncharacterized protein n=1 Tax=Pseudonocardia adelaidensis TaxID=648754 RepID=A0ABP9NWL7_9PSEU
MAARPLRLRDQRRDLRAERLQGLVQRRCRAVRGSYGGEGGEQLCLCGVTPVGVEAEADVLVHPDGGRPRGPPHLLHRRLPNTGHLLEPVIGRVQDIGDRAIAGLLERPEPNTPTSDLLERVDRHLAQPCGDVVSVHDLDLVPGAVAEHLRRGEQRRCPFGELTDGSDRRPGRGADLAPSGVPLIHRSHPVVIGTLIGGGEEIVNERRAGSEVGARAVPTMRRAARTCGFSR